MLGKFTKYYAFLTLVVFVIVSIIVEPHLVSAFFQPDYQNRGVTTFLDAYVLPGPSFQTYFSYFKSTDLRLGSKKAPRKFKLSVNVSLNQFAYVSKIKFLGGYLGGEVIIPVLNGHLTMDGVRSHDHGVGDIFLGGFLQSNEKTLSFGKFTMPFYFRCLAAAYAPTGDYDHEEAFSVGQNLTTFTFYMTSSFFVTPQWEISSRFMYNLHTTNRAYGTNRDDLKPGELFSTNFATSYAVRDGLRVGAVGYYWRQTTDDTLNSHHLRGRELALAFGPGLFMNRVINQKNLFILCHALIETTVRNRPKGNTLQVRMGVIF